VAFRRAETLRSSSATRADHLHAIFALLQQVASEMNRISLGFLGLIVICAAD
jgi:hypothetical protein